MPNFNNEADDPENWQRGEHPYAMQIFLYYLTEQYSLEDTIISKGFYTNNTQSPQEYLSNHIGDMNFKKVFTDWSMHNVAGFDYIQQEQWEKAWIEFEFYGDPNDRHDIVMTYDDSDIDGQWYRPSIDYVTRAWSYNVYKINNNSTASFSFNIKGDEIGSLGDSTFFNGRIVVMNNNIATYYEIDMSNHKDGSKTVNVTSDDEQIFLIVASTPNHFSSNQTYFYEIMIQKGSGLAIENQIIPDNYNITSIYPNPFNPSTTILFSIPEFGLTTITVYDITGRKLETLTNEVLSIGNYSINWNASSYPSGVYLIRMESGDFTQTQKVVLVK